MVDGLDPARSGPDPQGLIVGEVRDQINKVDQQLRSVQAVSRSVVAGYASAVVLLKASGPDTKLISEGWGITMLVVVFAVVFALALVVEVAATQWKAGADVDDLTKRSEKVARNPAAGRLVEAALLQTLIENLERNQARIRWISMFVGVQAYTAFVTAVLVLVFF